MKEKIINIWLRLVKFGGKYHWLFFGLIFAAGAFTRFWAAPLSCGVDVPQFWAFARVFQAYGIDFYRYAEGSLEFFPTQGWGYVYPPVWLLILRVALFATPGSAATDTWVESDWRIAEKTPIIAADLAIGVLLYWAIPGPKWLKLLFSGIWLLHPVAWYNSSVFGQFDAIAAVFLLAAVIMLEKGRDIPAFILAGLAVMTKQHTAIPVLLILMVTARNGNWRRMINNAAILALVFLVLSIPFLLTGNFIEYARSLFAPGQWPGYQDPLIYAFNGFSSLLTFLHNSLGWQTEGYIKYLIPALVLATAAAAFLCYKMKVTVAQAALAGFLILLVFTYRVNYQYLVVYIPLALLAATQAQYRSEKIMAIVMALLPAVWLWMFDVSFWFNCIVPYTPEVIPIFQRLGMTRRGLMDYCYVALAGALTALFLAYIVCTFSCWRKPRNESSFAPLYQGERKL